MWQGIRLGRLGKAVVPHLCADKLGRTTVEQDIPHNPGFQSRKLKLQNLWL